MADDDWDPFADPADAAVNEGAAAEAEKGPPPAAAPPSNEQQGGSSGAAPPRPSRAPGKDFDPYELLGVPHDATDSMIRSAFRKVSLRVHPDHCPDDPEAAAKFRELMETRDFLLNPFRRRLYNLRKGLGQRTQIIVWWSSWDQLLEEADAPDDEELGPAVLPSHLGVPSTAKTDVLVLGATGLIGMLACSWIRRQMPGLTWAIAGRDERKLSLVAEKFGRGPLFRGSHRADCAVDLERLARGVRIVVDYRGPKYQVGYDAAEACIRAGAHYIDTTGEPIGCLAAAAAREELDRKAQAAGVSLVFFCGSFTLPRDLGTWAMVEYLFERHQLSTRRINVYQKAVGQNIPGTFLLSWVNGPNPTEAKKSGAPFPLGGVRGGAVRQEDERKADIFEDEISGLWVQLDTDDYVAWVLRCSCGLFDDSRPYGDNFWVKCWNLLPDKQAGEAGAMNNAFVKRAYSRYVSESKLPPPSCGPKEDLRRQAFITNVFVAEAETEDGSEAPVAYGVLTEGPGGPGDPCEGTAVAALEVARCMLEVASGGGSGSLRPGFGTPSYHLGHLRFMERMPNLGYTWNVVDGAPPRELFRNILGCVAQIGG